MPFSYQHIIEQYCGVLAIASETTYDCIMGNIDQLGSAFTGRQIRALRKDLGLELKDVQDQLEHHGCTLSLSTLSRMETGKGRGPTVDELLALAVIFDVAPNRLLMGATENTHVQVTQQVTASHLLVWAWANGEEPLLPAEDLGPNGKPDALREYRRRRGPFREQNRPYDEPTTTRWDDIERLEKDGTLPKLFTQFQLTQRAGIDGPALLDYLALASRISESQLGPEDDS